MQVSTLSNKIKALYISYDGALDPLGQSQVVPYLKGLSNNGIKFILLTFEKKIALRDSYRVRLLKVELEAIGIEWKYLKYHKKPSVSATFYDLLHGIIVALWIAKREGVEIVHGRSFIGAVIALFLKKSIDIRFFLDLRGLWADERVDGNIFSKNGWLYKISKYIEKILLLSADEVIVLTREVKEIIRGFSYLTGKNVKIHIIPTCTDLKLFKLQRKSNEILNSLAPRNFKEDISQSLACNERLNKEFPYDYVSQDQSQFIFLYLGSLGTWYMLEEMLDFYCNINKKILNSHFLFITPSYNGLIYDGMKRRGVMNCHFSAQSVPYNDVHRWMSVANVSIFFIKPLFSKKSSCPTKFGESLACGLPVIINSGIGDCDEIVLKERVGVVVNEFSSVEYERAWKEMAILLSEGDELRQRCRGVAEKYFSLDVGVSKYWDIYKNYV